MRLRRGGPPQSRQGFSHPAPLRRIRAHARAWGQARFSRFAEVLRGMNKKIATQHDLPSPPLWGRAGEGGVTRSTAYDVTPSLTLPHKGGGNAPHAGSPWTF